MIKVLAGLVLALGDGRGEAEPLGLGAGPLEALPLGLGAGPLEALPLGLGAGAEAGAASVIALKILE